MRESWVQEIVVEPDRHAAAEWISHSHVWLPLCLGGFVLFGLRVALILGCMAVAISLFFHFLGRFGRRRWAFVRAAVDEHGLTLGPLENGWLSSDPFSFGWHEVTKIAFGSVLGIPLRHVWIRLDRPSRFWSLARGPQNVVVPEAAFWRLPAFAQAIRVNVAQDRIEAGALDSSVSPRARAFAKLRAVVLVVCATVLCWAAAVLVIEPSKYWLAALVASFVSTGIAAVWGGSGGVERESVCGALINGGLGALVCLGGLAFTHSAVSGDVPLLACMAGGASGLCLGAGLGPMAGPTARSWLRLALFYGLGVLGFAATWAAYDAVPSRFVVVGTTGFVNPWTPSGDAFLISRESVLGEEPKDTQEVILQWYTEDAEPIRSVTMSTSPSVRAVGENGALCVIKARNGKDELWYVPRGNDAPRKLSEGRGFSGWGGAFLLSPSGTYAVGEAWVHQEESTHLHANLDAGALVELAFPKETGRVRVAAARDDGSLLLLAGTFPQDEDGGRVQWRSPIPPGGVFARAGTLFRILLWHPERDAAPAQVYAATSQWLGIRRCPRSEYLYACRLVLKPQPHREFVRIDLAGDEPDVSTVTKQELEEAPQRVGRFTVRGEPALLFGRILITDARTGVTRPLRHAVPSWLGPDRAASPRGGKLLIETWTHGWPLFGTETESRFVQKSVVRLVDLDKDWR